MDRRRLVKLAREYGWTVDTTRKGHLRLTPPADWTGPDGKPVGPVVTSGSPSDWRESRNFEADLRTAGLPVPHRRGKGGKR